MSWQNTEYLFKGLFLGLLFYVGLQLRGPEGWRHLGQVALFTVGGLALFLTLGAVRTILQGYRLKGRLLPFLAFLVMENPSLVYAGILLGLAAGAFSITEGDPDIWQLGGTLGGGLVLGLLFINLKGTEAKLRFWFGLVLAAGVATVGIYYLHAYYFPSLIKDLDLDVPAQAEQAKRILDQVSILLGALLLLGIPFFYLLNLASVSEESEVEIAGICGAMAVGLWLLCQQLTLSNPNLQWIILGIPATIYYMYTRSILPGLRVFKHVLRGMGYANGAKYRYALASLGRAIHLDPHHKLARETLWHVHRQMDFHQVAAEPETLALVNFDLCLDRVAYLLLLDKPQSQQLEEAHRLLDLVASQKPAWLPRCDYWRTVAYCHERKYDDAQVALERVLVPDENPDHPQRKAALFPAWQLALVLHPELKRRVGDRQIDQPRRRVEAIAAVERRLAADVNDTAAWDLKRILYNDLSESQARQGVGTGLEFDGEYVKELGLALIADPARWERGAEFLRIAAMALPTQAPALFVQIAKAHERVRDIDGVYANYERAKAVGLDIGVKNLPADVRPVFFGVVKALAEDAARRGDLDMAIANFHLYTEFERAGLETYRTLADLNEKKKDSWSALHYNEHGMTYDRTDQDLLSRRDRYYYSVTPAELADRRESVAKWFDVGYCVAKARFLLDRPSDDLELLDWASHLVELAQVMQPNNFSVRVMRARVARRRGETQQAIALLEEVRNNKPEKFPSGEEEEAWFTACKLLGDLYLNERPDLAVACFQDFRKSTKSGADTFYKLGIAYENMGDRSKAAKCYQQVVAYETHPLAPEAHDALRRLQVG